ncbi:MAG: energy-coupling factor ABC transporter ATP-binding protein [Nitrososphaerales archaeon]
MGSLYELYDLTFEYPNNVKALDKISLVIDDAPLLILGHNGSGKTTLLKLLALLIKPKEGKIIFEGKDLSQFSNSEILAIRRSISYIPQKVSTFNGTLYNEVAYGLKVRGIKDFDGKVKSALKVVGLESLEKRMAKALSGGQARRLAIARALALDTKVLLFDEPTSELDIDSYNRIVEVILKEAKEGKKVIVATNDLIFAQRLNFKSLLLSQGKIVFEGKLRELMKFFERV